MDFLAFPKIWRVSRPCIITEKIDGTNAQICIMEDGEFLTGSRNRWITTENDHYGFAKWANDNKSELVKLGIGRHYGEWWGQGIQRNYGLKEKRFSLFNTTRWGDDLIRPSCCHVVPILFTGIFDTSAIENCIKALSANGSVAAPGFMQPEGVVCYHCQGNFGVKKTIEKDEEHKHKGPFAPTAASRLIGVK